MTKTPKTRMEKPVTSYCIISCDQSHKKKTYDSKNPQKNKKQADTY